MKKPTLAQLDKYDINQKTIKTLADLESRTILFSITHKSNLAENISKENKIPLSTVYKKLKELEQLSLIKIEKRDISEYGRVMKYYKSRISKAEISFRKSEPTLTLQKN